MEDPHKIQSESSSLAPWVVSSKLGDFGILGLGGTVSDEAGGVPSPSESPF